MQEDEIRSTIKTLEEKDLRLAAQREVIGELIEELLRTLSEVIGSNQPSEPIKKQEKLTAGQRFLNVLKSNQRFMKVREIARQIAEEVGGNEDDWVAKCSRNTRKLKKAGLIVKHNHDHNQNPKPNHVDGAKGKERVLHRP